MTRLEVDLLIVGAGPVGLHGAYDAGVRGRSVAVVDSLGQVADRSSRGCAPPASPWCSTRRSSSSAATVRSPGHSTDLPHPAETPRLTPRLPQPASH